MVGTIIYEVITIIYDIDTIKCDILLFRCTITIASNTKNMNIVKLPYSFLELVTIKKKKKKTVIPIIHQFWPNNSNSFVSIGVTAIDTTGIETLIEVRRTLQANHIKVNHLLWNIPPNVSKKKKRNIPPKKIQGKDILNL